MRELDLSVLIPSYNGAERVRMFLPSIVETLKSLDGVESEIIVVDDGSADGTGRSARTAAPSATVIVHRANRGASAARNSAAARARGRWLLCCDDDVELTASGLAGLWDARDTSRCLVPLVRDLGGDLQNSVTSRWRRGDYKFVQHAEPVGEVAYPMGACFLLSRAAYWRCGGFDDRYYPNGYEDAAFGAALGRAGIVTSMVTTASVRHHIRGGATAEERRHSGRAHVRKNRQHIYNNRWLFDLLVLTGWRRGVVVTLGLPRTTVESIRVRSIGPLQGYRYAWKVFLSTGRLR